MISAADAAKELIRRRAARTGLLAFTQYTKPDYEVAWHHEVTAQFLDMWIAGIIPNLIICEPPRYGKSELGSRRLPAYIHGRFPDAKIISATYSADLASMLNRDVQRIIESEEYARLFPQTRLNTRNVRSDAQGSYLKNNDIYEVVGKKGVYRSVGRGGGVTGMGGDYIIIDDPFKNKEEAHSPAIREEAYGWYTTTIRTRAEKNARKLIIATRWHMDDLIGRVLEDAKHPEADQWFVLVLPARANSASVLETYGQKVADAAKLYDKRNEGDLLWPNKFDKRADRASELALGPEDYAALYGQTPTLPGGRKFHRAWFPLVSAVPFLAIRVRYWDKAGTQDAGAYTVGALIAFDGRRFYIEDIVRAQVGSAEREALIKQTTKLDAIKYANVRLDGELIPYTVFIEQEPGSGGKESAENTILNLAGYNVISERPVGDKVLRAGPLAAQAYAGNIAVLEAPWTPELLEELENFPKGRYKDQVDACSGGFNKLALGWEEEDVEEFYEPVAISDY